MNLGLIGVGGAGGRIVDAIRRTEEKSEFSFTDENVLCFDTDRKSLSQLNYVPTDRAVPIGDTVERVARGPVDGDPDLAAEVARTDDYEIQRSFDVIPIEELDGLLLIAGIGGGTGGGAGSVILEMCQALFDPPVYTVAVLPREDESASRSLTASRALNSFVRHSDNVVVLDNETWTSAEDERPNYTDVNATLAELLLRFLAVGDFGGILAERRVDRTDIMRTLETGGVTTIGMAETSVYPGWRRWVRFMPWVRPSLRDGSNPAYRVKDLVRKAVEGPLTLECEIDSAERGLVILSGPPSVLSRRGFESARYWLEHAVETVEVIAGDEPQPRSRTLRAIVVLSNVTEVPRIEAMQSKGLEGTEEITAVDQ